MGLCAARKRIAGVLASVLSVLPGLSAAAPQLRSQQPRIEGRQVVTGAALEEVPRLTVHPLGAEMATAGVTVLASPIPALPQSEAALSAQGTPAEKVLPQDDGESGRTEAAGIFDGADPASPKAVVAAYPLAPLLAESLGPTQAVVPRLLPHNVKASKKGIPMVRLSGMTSLLAGGASGALAHALLALSSYGAVAESSLIFPAVLAALTAVGFYGLNSVQERRLRQVDASASRKALAHCGPSALKSIDPLLSLERFRKTARGGYDKTTAEAIFAQSAALETHILVNNTGSGVRLGPEQAAALRDSVVALATVISDHPSSELSVRFLEPALVNFLSVYRSLTPAPGVEKDLSLLVEFSKNTRPAIRSAALKAARHILAKAVPDEDDGEIAERKALEFAIILRKAVFSSGLEQSLRHEEISKGSDSSGVAKGVIEQIEVLDSELENGLRRQGLEAEADRFVLKRLRERIELSARSVERLGSDSHGREVRLRALRSLQEDFREALRSLMSLADAPTARRELAAAVPGLMKTLLSVSVSLDEVDFQREALSAYRLYRELADAPLLLPETAPQRVEVPDAVPPDLYQLRPFSKKLFAEQADEQWKLSGLPTALRGLDGETAGFDATPDGSVVLRLRLDRDLTIDWWKWKRSVEIYRRDGNALIRVGGLYSSRYINGAMDYGNTRVVDAIWDSDKAEKPVAFISNDATTLVVYMQAAYHKIEVEARVFKSEMNVFKETHQFSIGDSVALRDGRKTVESYLYPRASFTALKTALVIGASLAGALLPGNTWVGASLSAAIMACVSTLALASVSDIPLGFGYRRIAARLLGPFSPIHSERLLIQESVQQAQAVSLMLTAGAKDGSQINEVNFLKGSLENHLRRSRLTTRELLDILSNLQLLRDHWHQVPPARESLSWLFNYIKDLLTRSEDTELAGTCVAAAAALYPFFETRSEILLLAELEVLRRVLLRHDAATARTVMAPLARRIEREIALVEGQTLPSEQPRWRVSEALWTSGFERLLRVKGILSDEPLKSEINAVLGRYDLLLLLEEARGTADSGRLVDRVALLKSVATEERPAIRLGALKALVALLAVASALPNQQERDLVSNRLVRALEESGWPALLLHWHLDPAENAEGKKAIVETAGWAHHLYEMLGSQRPEAALKLTQGVE